jgi:hypothetical protein
VQSDKSSQLAAPAKTFNQHRISPKQICPLRQKRSHFPSAATVMSAHFPSFRCAFIHDAPPHNPKIESSCSGETPKRQKARKNEIEIALTYFWSSALHRSYFGPVWFHLMHFTVSVFGAVVFSVQLPFFGTGFCSLQ